MVTYGLVISVGQTLLRDVIVFYFDDKRDTKGRNAYEYKYNND